MLNYIEFYRNIALYDENVYKENIEEIEKQLEILQKEYSEKMESIRPTLSKKISKYLFKNGGFHEFNLVDISIRQDTNKRWKTKVNVILTLIDYDCYKYRLDYREVQKINIDSPTIYTHGIDQWDRSMFDITEGGQLKHQILFQSNTIITLECKNIYLHVEKIRR